MPENPTRSVTGNPKVVAAQAGGVPMRRGRTLEDLGISRVCFMASQRWAMLDSG